MTERTVAPVLHLDGEISVPGDKSISHRVLILGSLAIGRSRTSNLSGAADVASTADCLRRCGALIRVTGRGDGLLDGSGVGRTLRAPEGPLNCGNSGTTMRLMSGVLAGHDLTAVLDGDESLRRRPMERVALPLRAMGADIETTDGRSPITVRGRARLHGVEHVMEVASAQVKSAILFAALSAREPTTILEPVSTRDHTERLLRLCGVDVEGDAGRITLRPGRLRAFSLRVPGDLSSAAFFMGMAAARPGWRVLCGGVTLNPGRTGVIDVLRDMGATIELRHGEPAGGVEPCGDVEVCGGDLRAVTIAGPLVARCIDELPLLAVIATQAQGTTVIRGAAELRVKESDRIATVARGLRAMGAHCEVFDDGMAIEGPVRLAPAALHSGGDHRLAMAWGIAAALADPTAGPSRISGVEAAAVSYPDFFDELERLVGRAPTGD